MFWVYILTIKTALKYIKYTVDCSYLYINRFTKTINMHSAALSSLSSAHRLASAYSMRTLEVSEWAFNLNGEMIVYNNLVNT